MHERNKEIIQCERGNYETNHTYDLVGVPLGRFSLARLS
jgi:hypothetical protein